MCLFVCLFVSRLALSRICHVPYHQTQLATYSWPQYSNWAFKRKIITWSNLEEWVWMRSVCGNECRAIVRARISGYAWKKLGELKNLKHPYAFFAVMKAVDGVVLPWIVPVPYLSRTVPCHQRRLATMHIQIGLSNARSEREATWSN